MAAIPTDKNRIFKLKGTFTPLKGGKEVKHVYYGEQDDHARTINIKTIQELKYSFKEFKIKAGESIAIELENVDSMEHSLVIVKPGAYEK